VKFTYKGESVNGNAYILNDCIVLTKTIAKIKDKGVVNMLLKSFPNNSDTSNTLSWEHHYLETISLKDLEIIDISSAQVVLQLPQATAKWDFFF